MTAPADLLAAATTAVREGRPDDAARLYAGVLAVDPDNAEALRGLGAIEFQAGRYEAAEQTTRRLLALRPEDPAMHFGLGMVLERRGRTEEALAAYEAALAINPLHLRALVAAGELYRVRNRGDDAVKAARKAVAIDPANPDACNLLGAALQDSGHSEEALGWLESATAKQPQNARAHYNLGVALQALDRKDDAVAAYRRAVELDPQLMEARNNLGLLLVDAEEASAAIAELQVAVDLAPGSAVAHNSLGRAYYRAGRLGQALASFQQALHIDPLYAEAHANVGAVQRARGQPDAALATLDRALQLKPDLADAHGNRSMILRELGRLDEAADSATRAIAARPNDAEFHMMLALVNNDRGLHRETLGSARRAVALKPAMATLHLRLLGLLLYNPEPAAAERFAECRAFGARFGQRSPTGSVFAERLRDPERRLRIGYVSSDLRGDHPVARNLLPLFVHHDRSRFELFVYADVTAPDNTTDEFKALAARWTAIDGLEDRNVATAVRNDEVDILVCLAGRFDRNRPLVASYRPAPVQVTFHDPATSGLVEMDYLIADPILAPANGTERFTERVARLPHFYVHDPLPGAPPVRTLPLAATGAPTFGCFNNPAKLSDACLALWAQLLMAVPRARLMLKFRNWYGSEPLQRRVTTAFERAGIARDRLVVVDADRPGLHHLEIYNEVDVALDPFPFTGSTTTFEALWMGVPVVTLTGDSMVSRWTTSMLDAVQLKDLASRTEDGYVAAAAALVSDMSRLARLRASLRARVAGSPLCDGRRRTRQVERLYRTFWRRACAGLR